MNVIITGASEGLGLEIAKKFMKEGHSVAICARNEARLKKAQEQIASIRKNNETIAWAPIDVSEENAVKEFVKNCLIHFGKIDVLVNNAGIYGPFGNIEDVDSEEWKKCIDINLMGPFYFMKYIIPHMKENKYGKIINLSGGGATNPLPFISAYAASKCAIVRLTETIAKEVEEYNIDVNAIAPGALDTKMFDQVLDAGPEKVGQKFYDKITKEEKTPLSAGADLCYYLASKESDGITGKLISAKWDNYRTFTNEISQLDKYTLRRKV